MREFRPTPPGGGYEPEPDDPWSYSDGPHDVGPPADQPGNFRVEQPLPPRPGDPFPAAAPPPWGVPATYNHPRGTTVLVLGVLSVVVLPILGPFAWAMGQAAIKEVDSSGVPAANRSMLVGGMITGIIGTVFLVVGMLWFLAVVGLFATSVSTGVG